MHTASLSANRSRAWQAGALFLGTLFLALSSHVAVPMIPVPMTMQTLAVTLGGALLGARLGTLTVLAWLGEAMLGLPVLSGPSSLATFVGPTAGYLMAFPFAAALVGWLVERGWNGQRLVQAFAAMLAGNVLCLVLGAAWLSVLVGMPKALALGVTPFLLGGVLKSALGAATLKAVGRFTA